MLSTVGKCILCICCIVALLLLARYRFVQPLFAQYLSRQVEIAVNEQYGDVQIMGVRIDSNIFTVEGKEYDKIIYARYLCHFRCTQTDLFVEENGTGGFVKQKTEDTSRIKTAGKP